MGSSLGAYELNQSALNSNTTVPLQCVALVFLKAYVDRVSFS